MFRCLRSRATLKQLFKKNKIGKILNNLKTANPLNWFRSLHATNSSPAFVLIVLLFSWIDFKSWAFLQSTLNKMDFKDVRPYLNPIFYYRKGTEAFQNYSERWNFGYKRQTYFRLQAISSWNLKKKHFGGIDVKVLGLTFVKLAGFSFWIVCKLFCRLISLASLLRGVEERIEIHPGKGYNQNEAPACKGYAILKKGYLHISLHISSQTRRCAVIIQKSPMKIRNVIFIEIASS